MAFILPASVGAADAGPIKVFVMAGEFRYTRRNPAFSDLSYTVWVSTDLEEWIEDEGAVQETGGPDATGVESVDVTRSASVVDETDLVVQMRASELGGPRAPREAMVGFFGPEEGSHPVQRPSGMVVDAVCQWGLRHCGEFSRIVFR